MLSFWARGFSSFPPCAREYRLLRKLFLSPQRTLDLEYQDGGDELQNLITEITVMHDPGLFISVVLCHYFVC